MNIITIGQVIGCMEKHVRSQLVLNAEIGELDHEPYVSIGLSEPRRSAGSISLLIGFSEEQVREILESLGCEDAADSTVEAAKLDYLEVALRIAVAAITGRRLHDGAFMKDVKRMLRETARIGRGRFEWTAEVTFCFCDSLEARMEGGAE